MDKTTEVIGRIFDTKEAVPNSFLTTIEEEMIVLQNKISDLEKKNLKPYNFLKTGTVEPMVFAWMPALAIYFNDPDGNQLEFISILEGEGRPELGVLSYEEWMKQTGN